MMDSTKKNSLNLRLENFQALIKADFEFEKGINLICGESNSGKTAVFRALNGVLLNPKKPQKKYTNYKAKGFNVCLDYLGNEINWVVTSNKVKYVVNGEDFIKVGNTNLFKVLNKNGFVLGDNNRVINIEGEMELPFPFDMNNAELFKLFEKSMVCTSDTTVILRSMKDKENALNKELDVTSYEQKRMESKYEAVKTLEEEVDFTKLNKYRSTLKEMNFRYGELTEAFEGVKQGYIAHKKLQECKSVPEVSESLEQDFRSMSDNVTILEYNKNMCNVLQTECNLKITLPDVTNLSQMLKDYRTLAHNIKTIKAGKGEVSIPEIKVRLDEYSNLINDYKKLVALHNQCTQVTKDIKEIQHRIIENKEELDSFDVCPLCGQELKHEK